MNSGLRLIFVVLNILVDCTGGIDGEDISMTSMVVERITVHAVRCFLRGQDEDGPCLCIFAGSTCYRLQS